MPSRFSRDLPAPFEVEVEPDRETVAIRPVGELDLATCANVTRVIDQLREIGFAAFRIDLRRLTFIDSYGLKLVLEMVRDEDLAVTVIPGSAPVQRAFEVSGVAGAIPFQTARPDRLVAA